MEKKRRLLYSCHNGKALEAGEIQDFCRGKIARYKIPKHIFLHRWLPDDCERKIQKFKLREEAAARLSRITNDELRMTSYE